MPVGAPVRVHAAHCRSLRVEGARDSRWDEHAVDLVEDAVAAPLIRTDDRRVVHLAGDDPVVVGQLPALHQGGQLLPSKQGVTQHCRWEDCGGRVVREHLE